MKHYHGRGVEAAVLSKVDGERTLKRRIDRLTLRQQLVFILICYGFDQREIAKGIEGTRFETTQQTISNEFTAALKKLGIYWQTRDVMKARGKRHKKASSTNA